jgi:hypothetical protein
MASYFDALPNSFKSSAFVDGVKLSDYPWPDTPPKINEEFFLDERFNGIAENLTGSGALAGNQTGWTFITAPEDVSWDVANDVNRVDVFGTNNPPVVAGSRGMRDLTLGNSLAEGFVRGVSLEGKIAALESLMNYGLNSSEGFVSVPVYQVWANNKSYGGSNAYYIIKDVKVKEAMRDLQGNATRAYVDISLMQVPAYQVNSGRDQASEATLAPGAAITAAQKGVTGQADQKVPGPGSSTPATAADAKPAAGPGAGTDSTKPPQEGLKANQRFSLNP